MAIEPREAIEAEAGPVIENEIPTYRAISPLAVFSLVLGVASALTFANPWFGVTGALAIAAGLLADRKIRRYPDVLTGRGMAQAGVGLGLICLLAAATAGGVQYLLVRREAATFARFYQDKLQTGSLAEAIYYQFASSRRKDITPEKNLEELKASARASEMFDMQVSGYRMLTDRLRKGSKIHFVHVEQTSFDGLTPIALVLYKVDGPGAGPGEPADAYAVAEFRAVTDRGRYDWYVSELYYPAQPKSASIKEAPVDDGHGHGGGEHGH